ncbi:MAG TPA: extracellular solute-binding protein [Lachnospiraceae bacterium]|nr:extracellular solute-binding protein [Lachnospiraceae bacterium]
MILKKTKLLLVTCVIFCSCTACGSRSMGSQTVYENESSIISEDYYVSGISIENNEIYYAVTEWNNERENSVTIYHKNIYEENSQSLPITLGKGENVYSMCGVNNDLWILIVTEELDRDVTLFYTLRKYDMNGKKKEESTDINYLMESNHDQAILKFQADSQGSLCLIGDSGTIYCMNQDGTWDENITYTGDISVTGLYSTDEILVSFQNIDKSGIKKIDLSEKKLSSISDRMIYYATEQYGLSRYEKNGTRQDNILTWLDNGIFTSQIQALEILSDGTIVVVTCDYKNQAYVLKQNIIKQVEQSKETSKTIITYGVAGDLSESAKVSIVNFNTQNKEYTIKVVDYLEVGQASEDVTWKLNSAISSGEGPDLINVTDFDYQTYATKGVFEDLYLYINSDQNFHMEDYFTNILTCYSYGDQLFAVPREFSIETLVGSKEDFPETGWTLNEMYDYVDKHPEIDTIFEAGPQSMLSYLMVCYMDHFYNIETGSCNFNSQEFVDLLKFCKTYAFKGGGPPDNVKNGTQLLMTVFNLDYTSYQMYQQIFDGDITFVGYPDEDGNGAWVTTPNTALAIATYSKQKAGAWEFIKFSLSEEEQQLNKSDHFYPVHVDSYYASVNQQINMEMNTEQDENGNLKQVPSTYNFAYMTSSNGDTTSYTYEIYPPSQEMIDHITEVIENSKTIIDLDINVWNIIIEEDNYLKGDGDPWEMAKKIQNRVQVYVQESR